MLPEGDGNESDDINRRNSDSDIGAPSVDVSVSGDADLR
jgi:hypothetical protein